jgi:threonine dehydrogenase-like Zn-dependent dehydrogenase
MRHGARATAQREPALRMRAATLIEPRRFEVARIDPPAPGKGEILLRVAGCGVCGSDMGPWKGVAGISYPLLPGAPGHEVYGTVAAVGSGVASLAAGDPVTALAVRAYAELDLAPADSAVRLPPALAGRPVLGEPVACAVNVARRAGVAEGDLVVVVGTGFLGALLIPLLSRLRPRRIVAVSRRPAGLDLARRLGADEALTYDDDVRGRVGVLSGGRMADVVVEATGRQAPLDLAADLVRVRGRLIVAGYHQDGPRTVNMQSWNWRGLDVVNAHERDPAVYRAGMEEGVRLLAAGELDLAPLLTHRFPLAEINRAFATAEERPAGFLKAVVEP